MVIRFVDLDMTNNVRQCVAVRDPLVNTGCGAATATAATAVAAAALAAVLK